MLPWLSSITDSLLPAGATAAAPPITLNGKSAQLPSDWAQKVNVVYQMPDVRPQGVLALFHGCAHSATDFWPQSDRCPECRGLPVEVRITRMALQAGWATIALSSKDRESKCWQWAEDESRVGAALREFQRKWYDDKLKLSALPLAAFGACGLAAVDHHERVPECTTRGGRGKRGRGVTRSWTHVGAPALGEARLAGALVAAHKTAARNLEQAFWLAAGLPFQGLGQVVAPVCLQPLRAGAIAPRAQRTLQQLPVARLGPPAREWARGVPADQGTAGGKKELTVRGERVRILCGL